jgi:hypothetical protein
MLFLRFALLPATFRCQAQCTGTTFKQQREFEIVCHYCGELIAGQRQVFQNPDGSWRVSTGIIPRHLLERVTAESALLDMGARAALDVEPSLDPPALLSRNTAASGHVAEAVYLCVEKSMAAAVQARGFSSRFRPNVAVSPSVRDAKEAFRHRSSQPLAVFRVLLSPDVKARMHTLAHTCVRMRPLLRSKCCESRTSTTV